MDEADPWIGRVIVGRYRIEAIIGRGGFGAVYRGVHLGLDRPVALKRIRGGDDDLVARFHREARLQARLRHPVCVMVHDFVRDDGLWLVQELVDGETLEAVLRAEGALDPARAVALTCRLLEGLSAAHALRIVHRDIKPANVMLVRDAGREDVRLLDFGIARAMADEDTCMTSPGIVVGTPRYISPEQARGEMPSPANDIYAVGVLLHHMLAGQPPFRARLMRDAIVAHLTLDPPPLPPEITPALAAVVGAALAKSPAARPPSADAMIDRLRAALRSGDRAAVIPAFHRRRPPLDEVPSATLVSAARHRPDDPEAEEAAPAQPARPRRSLIGAAIAAGAVTIFVISALPSLDAGPADAIEPAQAALSPPSPRCAAGPCAPVEPAGAMLSDPHPATDDAPDAASAPPSRPASEELDPARRADGPSDGAPVGPSPHSLPRPDPRPARHDPQPQRTPPRRAAAPRVAARAPPNQATAASPHREVPSGDAAADFDDALARCECEGGRAILDRLYVTAPRQHDALRDRYMARCELVGPRRCR